MKVTVFCGKLNGEISAPCSKSAAHRLMLAAGLSKDSSVLEMSSLSEDIAATLSALSALGAEIAPIGSNRFKISPIPENKENLFITSSDKSREKPYTTANDMGKNPCGINGVYTEKNCGINAKDSEEITCATENNREKKPCGINGVYTEKSCGTNAENYEEIYCEESESAEKPCEINAKESGSTLRFLLPVVCALGKETIFTGEGRLLKRPLGNILALLAAHNAEVNQGENAIRVKGKLSPGSYEISGEISSQFITGLLFALPLLSGDSALKILGKTVSADYIKMTLDVLKRFGINILRTPDGFFIPGNQRYIAPAFSAAEGDWSGAAFFVVGGAIAGDVTIGGLNENSLQADRAVIGLLKKMGADISFADGKIRVKKSPLKGIDADCSDCPDLIPVLSVACACARGVSKIYGAARLADKESDRLGAIIKMLAAFKIDASFFDDCLTVCGGAPYGAEIELEPDHRMVMSACIMGLAAEGSTTVAHKEAAGKSYPAFFEDFIKAGGRIIG